MAVRRRTPVRALPAHRCPASRDGAAREAIRLRRTSAGVRTPGSTTAHRLRSLILTAAAAAVLSTCGAPSGPRRHVVEITAFAFQPDTLRASIGDTIVWINRDVVPHTATAREGAWDSGSVNTNGSWTHVVGEGGRISYLCTIHPSMEGWISVR